jgi:hypothetical protein
MVALLAAWGTEADDPETHAALGVRFQTPVPFSAPESIGLDAVALSNPPGAAPADVACEIVLCRMSADMEEAFGGDAGALLDYVKATFLATTEPAEGMVERTFVGQPSSGQTLTTAIPRPGRLEVHLVPLADGERLAVAVRSFDGAPAELADTVMATVAESLRDDDGSQP